MAFDLENAVQQGFNRDVTTNDWHVEARNLEIKLDDHGGVREFRILDNENVGVVVADSDGYLSVAGNVEVHGGHVLVMGESLTNSGFVTLQDQTDEVAIHLFDLNPDGTISGEQGSFGTNYNDGYLYVNTDGSTKWERLALVSQIPNLEENLVTFTETVANDPGTDITAAEAETLTDGSAADALHTHTGLSSSTTLHEAYKNDVDDSAAIIHTDSADGYVEIAGDQKFMVSATGGFDLDTGFDMDGAGPFDVDITGAVSIDSDAASNVTVDGADLTLSTTTSGDVNVTVPDGTGDFVLTDAGGSQYIKTITSNGELVLGDNATPVFVTVLEDMEVMGDLVVQGTTTTLNTQELFIEDRLVRVNTSSPSNFSGNVGIEAEVGSDGYVEFHWDDTQGRWEISIDRNTTPEAQTFRPLGYLAEDATTLDLSNTGDDGWPTAGPNPTAGASVINTNATNFPYTFGPDMTDDSVQAALEAIDGYFIEITVALGDNADITFQEIYDNSCGNATLALSEACGPLTIEGDEQVIFDNTGGTVFNQEVYQFGDGPFIVDITGPVNISSDTDINVASGDQVNIYGEQGIVLDGYGNDVTPGTSCTDSLGDSTHGWTDVFVCVNGLPISLVGDGDNDAPNTTGGATIIGTNPLNFSTFGPDMFDSNVQAALEAIDGYLDYLWGEISDNSDITFQEIYDNSCGNVTLSLSEACGPITFEGNEQIIFNNIGGIVLGDEFYMDGDGPFVINITGPTNISSDTDINIASGDTVNIYGEQGIVLDGYGNDVIPGTSCTDSLGDSTHGWTTIYLCRGNVVVGLGDAGGSSGPNTTSGATTVGTNPLNFESFGGDMTDDTVQAALEAIDGYLSGLSLENLDTPFTQVRGLDINGAVLNGVVKVSTDAGTPALDFKKGSTSRASWSLPVPADWDGISDFEVEVIWSPASTDTGDVEWRLEYKSLALTELSSSAASTDDYTQSADGTADGIQSTEDNLVIPAAAVETTDDLLIINLVRRGSAAGDTFTNFAQVHLVKYSYQAENIV